MPTDRYSLADIAKIVDAAHRRGLARLVCPHDGTRLAVRDLDYRPLRVGDRVRGVRYGDVDVRWMTVRCPTCGAERAEIDLTAR